MNQFMTELQGSIGILKNPDVVSYLVKGLAFTLGISLITIVLSLLIGAVLALLRNYCTSGASALAGRVSAAYIVTENDRTVKIISNGMVNASDFVGFDAEAECGIGEKVRFSVLCDILDACGDELPVWSGNDDLTVPLLSLGAKGVISVLSNVRPKRTLQMVRACQAGDYAAAGRMQVALTPLIDALFSEINPIPVKQALSLMGIPAGLPRLPLTPLSATHLPALEQALSAAPEP